MIYARVDNDTKEILEYPISVDEVKKRMRQANVSVPPNIVDANLRDQGYYPVDFVKPPVGTQGKRVVFDTPVWNESGALIRTFKEDDYSDRQLSDEWDRVRIKRDDLLSNSDWTELPSVRKIRSKKWASSWDSYRQSLRDITRVDNPFLITFPEPPNEVE